MSPGPTAVAGPKSSASPETVTELVLGIIIPCRNEAAVIERKLANLAVSRWPFGRRPHQIVIVDDGSTDGTAKRAQACCDRLFAQPAGTNRMTVPLLTDKIPAAAQVVPNTGRPGKAGAIACGIDLLAGHEVDLLVLTDADVIVRPLSFNAFEHAFRTRPELGMACGRQEFVQALLDDGSCRGPDKRDPIPAPETYDRWTAAVRRWESKRGRLFSVHGQLLAWRADLGLRPTPAIAADDIDLMLQVRAAGLRVEIISGGAFLEVKPADGAARRDQQVRRARAYVQVMREARPGGSLGIVGSLQLLLYRRLPLLLPTLLGPGLLAVAALAIAAWLLGEPDSSTRVMAAVLTVMLAMAAVGMLSPLGRRFSGLLAIIREAKRLERDATIADAWDRSPS